MKAIIESVSDRHQDNMIWKGVAASGCLLTEEDPTRCGSIAHASDLVELEGELHRLLFLYDRLDGLRCAQPERQKLRVQMARLRHEMECTADQPTQ